MQNGWEKLKTRWNENPVQVLIVGALVATAASKLIDSTSNARARATWAREVARREQLLPR